jgi:predicted lipoprotein with Yx(FWY)xxD motif
MKRWGAIASSLSLAAVVVVTSGVVSASGTTRNLVVTSSVRVSIFDALAKFHQLPRKDYVSLIPKMTYYAFDATNETYYAAAGLVASPHSLQAQVGTQDDGGYQLLTRERGVTTWKVYDDGLGGAEGTVCPIKIPPSVLAVWNWRPGACAPPA